MACLLILVVMALLALAVLVFHQRHHGRLSVRWWGLVLLAAFAGASFPLSIVTTLYFLIQSHFMGQYELALWITDGWRQYGRYASVVWLVGFPLVILLKGIVFTTRADAVRSISVAILIMLPLTVIDSSLFWVGNRSEKSERLTSVSPDGRLRVTAIGTHSRVALTYTLICEDNVPHPWLARRLASAKFEFAEFEVWPKPKVTASSLISGLFPRPLFEATSPMSGLRLVWSNDAKVVFLLEREDAAPYLAFDFSRDYALSLSTEEWVQDHAEEDQVWATECHVMRDQADCLLAEHGGLVPQPAATGSGG